MAVFSLFDKYRNGMPFGFARPFGSAITDRFHSVSQIWTRNCIGDNDLGFKTLNVAYVLALKTPKVIIFEIEPFFLAAP